MAVNERETQEPLYPRNHPYSSASAVGAPDQQDLLQAEVLDLRGRTQRAELRAEVLMRALKGVADFSADDDQHEGWRGGWCWCGGSRRHRAHCKRARKAVAGGGS